MRIRKSDGLAVRVLITAANLINDHGWTQHEYGDEEVGYCMIGAVDTAQGDLITALKRESDDLEYWEAADMANAADHDARVLLARGLRRNPNRVGGSRLVAFNDREGRKREQVMARFRKAIEVGRAARS